MGFVKPIYWLRRSCYQGLDHKSASSLTNPRGAELSKCGFSSVQAAKILQAYIHYTLLAK